MIQQVRTRTSIEDIIYSLHPYFSGLSLRNTSKAISRFIKRSHTAIRDWIQKYKPTERLSYRKTRRSGFISDETQLKVGSEIIWSWVAMESETKNILAISISKERNMFVAIERFLSDIVDEYGQHPVSTDGCSWYPSQVCKFLKINHHIHSSYEKSIIERTMQYIRDRTECFDDYFPCKNKKCKFKHVQQWFNPFADYYNKVITYRYRAIKSVSCNVIKESGLVHYGSLSRFL